MSHKAFLLSSLVNSGLGHFKLCAHIFHVLSKFFVSNLIYDVSIFRSPPSSLCLQGQCSLRYGGWALANLPLYLVDLNAVHRNTAQMETCTHSPNYTHIWSETETWVRSLSTFSEESNGFSQLTEKLLRLTTEL